MGARDVGHRLDFPDVEDPQVRLPLMKPVQRIMVRTEVGRRRLATDRSLNMQRRNIKEATAQAEGHNALPQDTSNLEVDFSVVELLE